MSIVTKEFRISSWINFIKNGALRSGVHHRNYHSTKYKHIIARIVLDFIPISMISIVDWVYTIERNAKWSNARITSGRYLCVNPTMFDVLKRLKMRHHSTFLELRTNNALCEFLFNSNLNKTTFSPMFLGILIGSFEKFMKRLNI